MGGFLAQPAKFYPNTFSKDGLFGRYPYLLPNLVAVVAIVLAIVQGVLFLEETNPMFKKEEPEDDEDQTDETTPLNRARSRARTSISHASFRDRSNSVMAAFREIRKKPSFLEESMPLPIEQRFDIRRTSFGTMHSIIVHPEANHQETAPETPRKTFNFTVVMITLSLVFMCYHQMAFTSIMPVWILDKPHSAFGKLDLIGGLGFTLHDVGTYLAVNGFIALFIQSVIFPLFVESVGVWRSFVSMVVVYPITYILVPFVSAFPEAAVSPGVYLALVLQGFFGIIMFPCALILLKNATPSPLVLGRVNGMAMSACCLARTVSPPLAGVIYAVSGSAAAWFSLAAVAILGEIQLIWIPREHVDKVEVESGMKSSSQHDSGYVDEIHEEAIEDD